MTKAELEALAERVEREQPSRELDEAVVVLIGPAFTSATMPPRYTTSLDAAVTLVPVDWNWSVERFAFDAVMPYAKPGAKSSAWRDSRNTRERIWNVQASTPAAALTAAALRARAQEARND